jgi:geranylgeranyl pyrophosphate synthase
VSLAWEAVGGKEYSTTRIGAALVLLAGGADIHDDLIDQSIVKEPKQTVFGKFGKDIAILAGDAFLLKGLYLLHDACQVLSNPDRKEILEIVKNAFFESSSAEAKEASLRGRVDISLKDFLEIIHHKVATAEAATRIGAVFGKAKRQEINALGHFGRTYGKLLALRDEFVDTFEIDELNNRIHREILPLPILLALNDGSTKAEMSRLIEGSINEEKVQRILDLSMDLKKTRSLVSYMKALTSKEVAKLRRTVDSEGYMEKLLWATLEDL